MTRCANDPAAPIGERERRVIESFRNFLSWGVQHTRVELDVAPAQRPVPPAWYAHVWGLTDWCPPEGEM